MDNYLKSFFLFTMLYFLCGFLCGFSCAILMTQDENKKFCMTQKDYELCMGRLK